jgi:hypothetical protein
MAALWKRGIEGKIFKAFCPMRKMGDPCVLA